MLLKEMRKRLTISFQPMNARLATKAIHKFDMQSVDAIGPFWAGNCLFHTEWEGRQVGSGEEGSPCNCQC